MAVAYLASDVKNLKRFIKDRQEYISSLRDELRQWQVIKEPALRRNEPQPKPKNIEVRPQIVHRGQMEHRFAKATQDIESTTPVTINADRVNYTRLQRETLEKASKVIKP